MAKTRKTRSSAPITEPNSDPTLPTSPEPTPESELTILSEPEQTKETEPEENQETMETEEPIVSEPEQTKEEATVTEPDQNPETILPQDQEIIENEAVVQENGDEKLENVENEEELEEESVETLIEPFTKDQLTLLIKQAVSRHPDLIENVNKLADFDSVHRKIFVHGLGYDSTVETVTSIFQEYGEIEDCRLVKDKATGKSKGYAFILFKKRKSARLALRLPQKMIGGRLTSSQLASSGSVGVGNGNQLNEQNLSELSLRKIFVSNVGAETDTNKLTEFFAKFGEIEDGPLGLDKVTGKARGFCLFVFKNAESVKKALVEPHKSFEGQMLHCQQAVDGPRNGKGGISSSNFTGNVAKRGRYSYNSGGGHMMAPSARPVFSNSHVVAPEAIGHAFATLLAQGGGGYGNMVSNVGYGGQGGGYGGQPEYQGRYAGQPGYQGGYGGQQQMGQGGVWPYQGGAPYRGHGR